MKLDSVSGQMEYTGRIIDTESPVEFSWEDARMGNLYTPEAYDYFKRLEFKNLLSRFDQQETEQKNSLPGVS